MPANRSNFDIAKCARPNILGLPPYTTARGDFTDNSDYILLDANENAFGPCVDLGDLTANHAKGVTIQSALEPTQLHLNVYPESDQTRLKQQFCDYRNTRSIPDAKPLTPENVCFGVGSDESFDGILRAFCVPGKDKILICPPTYSMYTVSAQINDVGIVKVDVDLSEDNYFALRTDAIMDTLANDPHIKVIFVCSPGNPTGTQVPRSEIVRILEHPTWNGIVVVDEAYIEFAPPGTSMVEEVNDWPNLVVTHTMSKAFGMDGIRLGVAYAAGPVSQLLNLVRGPYNMTAPTSRLAAAALHPESTARMKRNVVSIAEQRARVVQQLAELPRFGGCISGSYVNFILIRFLDRPKDQGGQPDNETAQAVCRYLRDKCRIIVRYRGNETGCVGCARISVGNPEQMDRVVAGIEQALEENLPPTEKTKT